MWLPQIEGFGNGKAWRWDKEKNGWQEDAEEKAERKAKIRKRKKGRDRLEGRK